MSLRPLATRASDSAEPDVLECRRRGDPFRHSGLFFSMQTAHMRVVRKCGAAYASFITLDAFAE